MRSVKLVALLLVLGIAGCAPALRMPLQPAGPAPDLSRKSVLVARVKIRNDNRPGQQPVLAQVTTVQEQAGKGQVKTAWKDPTLLSDKEKGGKEYFASLEVAPGKIQLDTLWFNRAVPLLLNAWALAPIKAEIEVPAGKILYLGTIDAVIVPKTSQSDRAAGGVVPLIDQSVAGFSNGKWQLGVLDEYEADLAALREKYPFLADVEVERSVIQLPGEAPPAPAEPPASN